MTYDKGIAERIREVFVGRRDVTLEEDVRRSCLYGVGQYVLRGY
ncbi:MAG: hypothetical protein ABFS18_10690 [Thermodesulfobacteriota bacterium]